MVKCIINGKVILRDEIVSKNIFINGDKIIEISERKPIDEEVVDARGLYVSPGFIDIHTHGRGGNQFMVPTYKSLNEISKATLMSGVTSFLVGTVTSSIESIAMAIENVAIYKDKVEGAKILGVHMEGPYFSKDYKGAQPEGYMILPTVENYLLMVKEHQDIIKKVSLAPELKGCQEFIQYLKSKNVIVSLGHSNATYEQTQRAIDMGVTSGTHTYNAMRPLNHREAGVIGAIMLNDDVYAELILDGIHVSYPAAKILLKVKGKEKVVLITDSVETAGLPDGKYETSMGLVYVKDHQVRLENGTLAGSNTDLNRCVKNAYINLGLTLNEAVNLASYNPAKSLNEKELGEIKIGNLADIIFFDDEINIKQTIINGKIIK